MSSGVYSVLSGALAKMRQLEVAVHNLANAGNAGFKADRLSFESVFNEKLQNGDGRGINFAKTTGCYTDFGQGEIEKTNQSLDIAIQGKGFFKVSGEEGFRYTRQGNFKLDDQGALLTFDSGLQVVGEDGPVNLPHSNVFVEKDGTITADGANIGRLTIYEVSGETDLERKGDGLWELKGESDDYPSENAILLQGSLEKANVNPVQSTTEIISLKRAYAAYMKTMKTFSEISEKSNQIGKLG